MFYFFLLLVTDHARKTISWSSLGSTFWCTICI